MRSAASANPIHLTGAFSAFRLAQARCIAPCRIRREACLRPRTIESLWEPRLTQAIWPMSAGALATVDVPLGSLMG